MNPPNKIKNSYLLYVGNAYPHKNLRRLIKAFKIVSTKFPKLLLVLVGRKDHFYHRIEEEVKKLGLNERVIFTDELSYGELSEFYKNGLAYIFPSLSEGFGLPGLEAMKHNLPVISSNKKPLPEIYGQAAVYFDPENIQDMTRVISETVFNHLLREKLKILGQIQVKKYSWKRCAQQTMEVYKWVLEQ